MKIKMKITKRPIRTNFKYWDNPISPKVFNILRYTKDMESYITYLETSIKNIVK